MTNTVKKAIAAYREAITLQAHMPTNEQWKMSAEIKRLKAVAYIEMEQVKLFGK